MTRRIGNVVIIEPEPERVCELCSNIAELRPYGPNGARVCFPCAMKDEEKAKEMFHKFIDGAAKVIVPSFGLEALIVDVSTEAREK
jgi:hypothetical protein